MTREKRVLAPKPVLERAAWATGKADHATGRDSGEGHPSSPPGVVRRSRLHLGGLPLATLVDSDFLGIDHAPGPRGVASQVITYGRHSDTGYVLAASRAQSLEDFADELEAGNFVCDMKRTCAEFDMKHPGAFGIDSKSWSKARLSPEFPRRTATL